MVNLNEEISRIKSIMGVITESDKFGMSDTFKKLKKTIEVLKEKDKVLLLSCSNRYQFNPKDIDIPKSKLLAMYIQEELGD